MPLRTIAAAAVLACVMPLGASAQDFGVMNSAETINRGNFKLLANPIVVFHDGDNDIGVAVMGGYGLTDRFDLEAKVAFFDDVTFIGADAEFWLVQRNPLDVSAIIGLHTGRVDGPFDTTGIDLTFLGSGHVTPRLELYGALDFAFNSYNADFIDDKFTTVHFVPGIEYALSNEVDFVFEVGLGLNDDSRNYLSGGLAFYFR